MPVFTGGPGSETLTGTDENDTIQGLGGGDTLDGGQGLADVVSYADSTVAVSAALNDAVASGGTATDNLAVVVDSSVTAGAGSVSADVLTAALAGNIYINLHSNTNPSGEVRGQLALAADNRDMSGAGTVVFSSTLLGANEVPPVTTDAAGSAYVVFTVAADMTVTYDLQIGVIGFDASEITGGHFHEAPEGSNGSVVENILTDEGATVFGFSDTVASNGSPTGGGDAEGDVLSNFEIIEGSAFDDTLSASGQAEATLNGGDGDDALFGGLLGQALNGGFGNDTLEGGDGDDRLDGGGQDDMLLGGGGNDTLIGSAGRDTLDGGDGDDFAAGSVREDSILGNEGDDTLNGNNGDDTIDGGDGADLVFGGPANDSILGNDEEDTLRGNAGDDTIDGESGEDDVLGGADNDSISGGDDADTLGGNAGDDSIDGGDGADSILGQANDDLLFGGEGEDTISGNGASDSVFGGNGADLLRGNAGDDIVYGEGGADQLLGGNGDDIIVGGAGEDRLAGNNGSDVFIFTEGDSGSTLASADLITDFSQAENDVIRLVGIDAITGGGDDSFDFIGTAAFSGTAGELRYEQSGGRTNVFGDTDGDGTADFALQLLGTVDLVAGDFVL